MFIDNKYSSWYFAIIQKAQSEARSKGETYYESHHITPKSLGGSNGKSNLVLLTAREHLLCHWLLTKMLPEGQNKGMVTALVFMTNKRCKNSRLFEYYRLLHSEQCKGRKLSEEAKEKLRVYMTGKTSPNKGKKLPREWVDKVAAANTGKKRSKPVSEEKKEKIRLANTGQKRSEETKAKMRASRRAYVERMKHDSMSNV